MGLEPIMIQEFLKNSWANLEDQEEEHDKEAFKMVTSRKKLDIKLLKSNISLDSYLVILILPYEMYFLEH